MPTLLLIDDNPLISDFVRLAVPDWRILSAMTGRKGLALLREHDPAIDVIVLDVGLPGMDGRLVCARIRAIAPALPIVPFTGNAYADDELREMGCEPAVLKGSGPQALAAALAAALQRGAAPQRPSALMEFVQEYAARVEQAEQRESAAARYLTETQTAVPASGLAATLDDLDLHLVRRHIARAVERRGYAGPSEPLDYLGRHYCLLETEAGLAPTLIGILMFAPEAERWVSAAGVDAAEFGGAAAAPGHLRSVRQIRGPLTAVIEQTVDWLRARTEHADRMIGAERVEEQAYPPAVLRELTVNALAHRDWGYRGSTVRVQVFPTRIEWITPGGLPAGVTAANIRTAQVSRNPALMHLLYHAGLVETLGLGMDTVLDALEAAAPAGDQPIIVDDGSFVTFRVAGRPLTAAPLAPAPADGLTRRQETILAEIRRRGRCSTADLALALGETMRTVQRDLKALVEAGHLAMEGQTHNRRYRPR